MARDKDEIAEMIKPLWASNVATYIKCLGYHQNVSGHKFYETKMMFKEIYKFLDKYNSKIGNTIGWCGAVVPASIGRIEELNQVEDDKTVPTYVEMNKNAYQAMKICRKQAEAIVEKLDEVNWPGMSDLFEEYCKNLDKYMFWCERSTIVVDTKAEGDDATDAEGNTNDEYTPEDL